MVIDELASSNLIDISTFILVIFASTIIDNLQDDN